MATYEKNQLHQVPLAELQPDPTQPRKYMDPLALEELTTSVSQIGIIEPIVCRQDPATNLVYVVAGERRCAAARKAGLATVPAIFIDGTNYAEIALVENLLRQDLNPVEEAEALKRLMDDYGYQQDQVARIFGRSPATISVSLSINRLPKAIRDECRQDPTIPKKVLLEIAQKKQERGMVTQFQKYLDQREKAAARQQAETLPSRKRTKAETLANQIGALQNRMGELDFPTMSEGDREMVMESLNSLKNALEETLARATKKAKILA